MNRKNVLLISAFALAFILLVGLFINSFPCIYYVASYISKHSSDPNWWAQTNMSLQEVNLADSKSTNGYKAKTFGINITFVGYDECKVSDSGNDFRYEFTDYKGVRIFNSSFFSDYKKNLLEKGAINKITNIFDYRTAVLKANIFAFSLLDVRKCQDVDNLLDSKMSDPSISMSDKAYQLENKKMRAILLFDTNSCFSSAIVNNPADPDSSYGMVFANLTYDEVVSILGTITFDKAD